MIAFEPESYTHSSVSSYGLRVLEHPLSLKLIWELFINTLSSTS